MWVGMAIDDIDGNGLPWEVRKRAPRLLEDDNDQMLVIRKDDQTRLNSLLICG
jgi:hypothetical protein